MGRRDDAVKPVQADTADGLQSVALLTPTGRVTLSGDRLITTTHGRREETVLVGEDAVTAALAEHFGLVP